MVGATPTEVLYACQVCDTVNLPATDLTWYFYGAEIRADTERQSKSAWYCTSCVATINLREGAEHKGPRLDIAIREHELNKL